MFHAVLFYIKKNNVRSCSFSSVKSMVSLQGGPKPIYWTGKEFFPSLTICPPPPVMLYGRMFSLEILLLQNLLEFLTCYGLLVKVKKIPTISDLCTNNSSFWPHCNNSSDIILYFCLYDAVQFAFYEFFSESIKFQELSNPQYPNNFSAHQINDQYATSSGHISLLSASLAHIYMAWSKHLGLNCTIEPLTVAMVEFFWLYWLMGPQETFQCQ